MLIVFLPTVCPWAMFLHNNVIPIYRLIFLGILILLFRRVPIIFAMHRKISQIEEKQQALFVGFFGPIGVSAVFYLYVSLEFLRHVTVDGVVRDDATRLSEVMMVVIWFLAICSIVRTLEEPVAGYSEADSKSEQIVHGLSIPIGKLGYHLPRTLSSAMGSTSRDETASFEIGNPRQNERQRQNEERTVRQRARGRNEQHLRDGPPRPVFRVGGAVIRTGRSDVGVADTQSAENSGPGTPAVLPDPVPDGDLLRG